MGHSASMCTFHQASSELKAHGRTLILSMIQIADTLQNSIYRIYTLGPCIIDLATDHNRLAHSHQRALKIAVLLSLQYTCFIALKEPCTPNYSSESG